MTFVLLMAFAYLLGGVPFGLLFGRMFADVDVRDFGSGNIGATNVNRVLGRKLGAATLAADVIKGLIPVGLALILLSDPLQQLWVGLAAVVGHIFPLYLKFQGGKGVATAFGVLTLLVPKSAFLGLLTWLVVVRLSKVSALGALSACLVIPAATFFIYADLQISLLVLGLMILIVYRHKENIQRLRSGSES